MSWCGGQRRTRLEQASYGVCSTWSPLPYCLKGFLRVLTLSPCIYWQSKILFCFLSSISRSLKKNNKWRRFLIASDSQDGKVASTVTGIVSYYVRSYKRRDREMGEDAGCFF